jgi:hypothetical protein
MSQARKEPIVNLRKVNLFSGLTAIASMSTLICCALPALLALEAFSVFLLAFSPNSL